MKRFSLITILILSLGLQSTTKADGPDDSFIQAYTLITEADNLSRLGQKNAAIQKYGQARNSLTALQSGYPNWNAAVVNFRIKYIDQKLKAIGTEAPEKTVIPSTKPPTIDPDAARREIAILKRRVDSLENSIILKDAKLKEALSAVPTPEETKRLAKLESDLFSLRQENNTLKGSIDKATAELKDASSGLAKAQAELTQAKKEAEESKLALAKALEETKISKAKANDRQTMRLEKQLSDKQESLKKTEKELSSLKNDKVLLEKELKSFKKGNREKDLQAEINSLQKQLADKQNDLETAMSNLSSLKIDKVSLEKELKSFKKGNREKNLETKVGSLEKQLAKSEGELKKASSSLAAAESSNETLEDRLKTLQKNSREKEMIAHINTLEKRLAKAERQNTNPASRRKAITGIFSWRKEGRAEKANIAELQNRIDTLRSRLEILEAEKIPYTDDEKKLFAEPKVESQPANTLEAKVATLPEEATAEFKAGQAALVKANYSEAEQKFLHVLKLDEQNPLTLSNLAMAQMEQGNYDGAEASLLRALEKDDQDSYALSLLGTLRYRQKDYEKARDHLAKAVKLNPEDANAQHFLGSTLNNLGQRKAAETALRKALQIKPGHAEAHHNLAVVYATQKPPFVALAKFHYEKAKAAGHAENADLEKILGEDK